MAISLPHPQNFYLRFRIHFKANDIDLLWIFLMSRVEYIEGNVVVDKGVSILIQKGDM